MIDHRICNDATSAYYFLHIPKTAGTSFMDLLHQHYPADQVCPAYLWHQMLHIPPEQRSAYQIYRGHFYAYLPRVVHRPLEIITFLRDPIERSLSHYAHIYRDDYHYFHKRSHQQGTLLAFLRDPVTQPMITNFQTRALAFDADPLAIAATLTQQQIDSLEVERILETMMPEGISDDELLQRAKQQIDQALFVGFTEQFDESIERLGAILGWQQTSGQRLNTSPQRPHRHDLDAETLAELREQTALDAELYAYALAKFEQGMGQRARG